MLALVPILISKGANVNQHSTCRSTPLHLAAGEGNVAIVHSLLEQGADPNATDRYGCRPADRAWQAGHADICNVIMHAGGTMTSAAQTNVNSAENSSPMAIQACAGSEVTNRTRRRSSMEAPGTPLSVADEKQNEGANTAMLQTAFSSLSLHDKCALSLSLAVKHVSSRSFRSYSTEQKEDDVDVASVITDSDKESLDVAMAMMSPAERAELEGEARVIQV